MLSLRRLLEVPVNLFLKDYAELAGLRTKISQSVTGRIMKLSRDDAYLELIADYGEDLAEFRRSLNAVTRGSRRVKSVEGEKRDDTDDEEDEDETPPWEVAADDRLDEVNTLEDSLFFALLAKVCSKPDPARVLLADPADFRCFFQIIRDG